MKRPNPKPNPFVQVELKKGIQFETVWIPKKYAKLHAPLKVRRKGVWDDHWIVNKVFREVDESVINGIARAVKKHREFADVPHGTFKKPEGNQDD